MTAPARQSGVPSTWPDHDHVLGQPRDLRSAGLCARCTLEAGYREGLRQAFGTEDVTTLARASLLGCADLAELVLSGRTPLDQLRALALRLRLRSLAADPVGAR